MPGLLARVEVPRLQHLRRFPLAPLYLRASGRVLLMLTGQTLGVLTGAWKACPGCGCQLSGQRDLASRMHPEMSTGATTSPPARGGQLISQDRGLNGLQRPRGRTCPFMMESGAGDLCLWVNGHLVLLWL